MKFELRKNESVDGIGIAFHHVRAEVFRHGCSYQLSIGLWRWCLIFKFRPV